MSTRPLVSVIIPHLNQPDALEACLSSLDTQTFERSSFEVIVVDNGSTLLPAGVIAEHPGTLLLQELSPGPGLARNRGIEAASAEILAFIDADCRAHANWLSCALRTLEGTRQRTILGGDVQIWCESESSMTALEAYESVFAYRFKLYIERHGFSGTGNLVLRRSDFDSVGPFGGIEIAEDVDWGKRASSAGFKFIYVPEMIVFHPARRSLGELFTKWDRHIQHAVNTRGGGSMWSVLWFIRAFAVLISPVVDCTKVVASDRINGPRARMKAILVLIAVRTYRAYKMILLLFSNKGIIWNRNEPVSVRDVRHDATPGV